VLSYTGGTALTALRQRLGAKWVAPLYGSVDPDRYRPAAAPDRGRAALSYLGTYADDRQDALNAFFIEPARQRPEAHFIIGGAQYSADFPWAENIFFFRHLASSQHSEFYASARLTLNVTRRAMASFDWCASGRLFEAGAYAAPIISDWWEGLDEFFVPDREILIARTTDDVLAALDRSNAELTAIGTAGLERTRAAHTAEHRAIELETLLSQHWE
jgi:spore maturation protein CgeB